MAALLARGCARVDAGFRQPPTTAPNPRVQPFAFDLKDDATIAAAAASVAAVGQPDMVFVATGILHGGDSWGPEKAFRAIDAARMADVFAINAIGPALIARHFLPLLPRQRRAVFAALSARVGSISDNRLGGWHAYRASKAALNMLIVNFAIELKRSRPEAIAVALHPGTVATDLSADFRSGLAPGQLQSADDCAAQLLAVLDGLRPEDSGGFFAWNGQRIGY